MARYIVALGLLVCALLCPEPASATALLLDFESFSEGDPVGTPFAGITFLNATVGMAGSAINELDYPPRSGANAAYDDSGFITVNFAAPVLSFSGYFTYRTALTLTAFDSSSLVVDSVSSAFSSNLGTDPGTVPNEFLQLLFAGGISSLTIAGDPSGFSFVLDDVTISPLDRATAVPEPGTISLLAGGVALLLRRRLRRVPVDNAFDRTKSTC